MNQLKQPKSEETSFEINSRFYLCAVGLIMLISAWARFPGFNPDALWYDDAWVALIERAQSWNELYGIGRSSPIGFSVITLLCLKAIPDLEIGAQLVPFIAGLLQIPLFGLLILKIMKDRGTALFGAALIAVSPCIVDYSTRVKQYTIDSLATILLLYLFVKAIERHRSKLSYYFLFGGAIAVSFFSHTACLVGFVLVNTWIIRELFVTGFSFRQISSRIWCGGIYNLFLMGYYFGVLSGQSQPHLKHYWRNEFMPLDEGIGAIVYFLEKNFLLRYILKAFPEFHFFEHWYLILGILPMFGFGSWALFKGRGERIPWMNIVLTLLYVQGIMLAALHIYPLGGRRIDIYMHPIHLLVFVAGFHCLIGAGRSRLTLIIGLILTTFVVLIGTPGWITHPQQYQTTQDAKQLIEELEEKILPDDLLILHRIDLNVVALYSKWPTSIQVESNSKTIELHRDNTLYLPVGREDEHLAERIVQLLDGIPIEGFKKIYLFSSQHVNRGKDREIYRYFEEKDYRRRTLLGFSDSRITLFETKIQ